MCSTISFSRNNVLVIGDLMQLYCVIYAMLCDPLCWAICIVIGCSRFCPICMYFSWALMCCLLMHMRYAFLSVNASILNLSCSNYVIEYDMHFGNPLIVLCRAITFCLVS